MMHHFPFKSYSWTIFSPMVFLKEVDKSALLHRGTGIPREIRSFFNIEHLMKGDRKEVQLIYAGTACKFHLSPLDKIRRIF